MTCRTAVRPASAECRDTFVGKSPANAEEMYLMGRALARDKGFLFFDLSKIKSEAERLWLRALAKRYYGIEKIGGPV